jgi:hypothetical protein
MKRVASKRERKLSDKSSPEGVYVAIPTLESYPWPSLSEPVSLRDAVAALTLGNAKILARYLREPEDLYYLSVVTYALAELLDPSPDLKGQDESPTSTSFAAALGGDCLKAELKLVFVRQRRGQPKKALDYWIGHMINATLGEPPNVEAAVANVMDRTGLSRATAFRAWKSYKSKMQAYEKAAKEEWEGLDESTREEFESLAKSLGEQLKNLQARRVSPKSD